MESTIRGIAVAGKMHLRVLQGGSETQLPAIADAQRTEVAWNDDFTAFRLIPLKWWDDASYAAYELDGIDTGAEGYDGHDGITLPLAPLSAASVASLAPAAEDDGLPF